MKAKSILLLASLGILCASVGATAASWAVTDNADSFAIKIGIDIPIVDPGYYLVWNNGDPIKLGEKVDTELKVDVSVTTTGSQSFKVTDENGTVVTSSEGTVTLDMVGTYKFCYKNSSTYTHGTSDHTYMYFNTYLTDNFGWGENNIKCYLYNGNINNTWPGNEDYTVAWEKTDQYGKEVYKISINAARYASSGSKIVFNNNNGDQTSDIDLCTEITNAGVTAFYTNDSGTFVPSVDVSNVSWWKDSGHHPVAYYFGGTGAAKYEAMTLVSGSTTKFVATTPVDLSKYSKVIFVDSTITGSGSGWPGGDIWKQTVDIDIPSCESCLYTLSSTEEGGKQTGSWGTKYHGFGTYTFE